MIDPIGHIRYGAWRITVSRQLTEFGLTLWLGTYQVDADGKPRTAAAQYGLVRVESLHGRTVQLIPGAAGLTVLPRSDLAEAIAGLCLKIHRAAGPYTTAILDPSRLDMAAIRRDLEMHTAAFLAAAAAAPA